MALALPCAAGAQDIACRFALVCAPEIDCVALEDLPFDLRADGEAYILEFEGEPEAAVPQVADGFLDLAFRHEDVRVVLTIASGGDAVASRHEPGPDGRMRASSFIGRCEGTAPALP